MSDDELKARRAAALAEDRCFSRGRLRDEFRMKPAPGAEPVRWYKNGYGSKYGVWCQRQDLWPFWGCGRFPGLSGDE